MAKYAAGTTVTVENSQAEVHRIVARFGADAFSSGYVDGSAFITFRAKGRFVRLTVPLPGAGTQNHDRLTKAQLEAETRRRWRSLVVLVKAKLAAVDDGISEFEQEFLANIVMPDNRTVGEYARPAVAEMYATGQVHPLLPPPR